MKKSVKKTKAAAKPVAAKVAVKKSPAVKTKFEAGQDVLFAGYGSDVPKKEQIFKTGQRLHLLDVEVQDGTALYHAVAVADLEAYKEDADSVNTSQVIESEITKAPKEAKTAVAETVVVKHVGQLKSLLKKGDVLETAINVFEDAKKQFFFFGGLLATIYYENKYAPDGTPWVGSKEGREAWELFTEANFGIKGAVARGYIDIYMSISAIPDIDVKRVAEIGWSKAAEISKYITEENFDEIFSLAEDKPITELRETLRTTYVDEDGKTPSGRTTRASSDKMRMTDFSFKLFEDQAASATYILEQAQRKFGHESLSETFEAILTEWAADHLEPKDVKKAESSKTKVQKDAKKRGVAIPGKKKETVSA